MTSLISKDQKKKAKNELKNTHMYIRIVYISAIIKDSS